MVKCQGSDLTKLDKTQRNAVPGRLTREQ